MRNWRSARTRRGPRTRYYNKFQPYEVKPLNDITGWVGVTDEKSYFSFRDLLASANDEVLILTYQISLREGPKRNLVNDLVRILVSKIQKNATVKILLNWKFKADILGIIQDRARKILKREGCEVRVFPVNKTLHSKLIIVDKQRVYLGSHNLTTTAMVENAESGIIINSKEIAEYFREYFFKHWGE